MRAGSRFISPPAVTRLWLANICSARVEPERNRPQMKIGAPVGVRAWETGAGKARIRRSTKLSTEIGRAHVWTPVTNAHLVCRLLLEKKKQTNRILRPY